MLVPPAGAAWFAAGGTAAGVAAFRLSAAGGAAAGCAGGGAVNWLAAGGGALGGVAAESRRFLDAVSIASMILELTPCFLRLTSAKAVLSKFVSCAPIALTMVY